MRLPLTTLTQNLPLKIISLIFGTLLWLVLSQSHTVRRWHTVPLYFYNMPNNIHISAPEQIDIELASTRSLLDTVDDEQLAVHIDASTLSSGRHALNLKKSDLFLPEHIKLVSYCPAHSYIEVTTVKQHA